MQFPIGMEYQYLANAVVLQAVEDYRNALDNKGYDEKSPAAVLKETKKFFRSAWFRSLTNVDADYLLEQIDQERREKERDNDKN